MIMPCINSTSFAECGGNVARVDAGKDLVGWPGAPGWTTTGDAGSACCAQTDSDNKHVSADPAIKLNHFIGMELFEQAGPYIITKRPKVLIGMVRRF